VRAARWYPGAAAAYEVQVRRTTGDGGDRVVERLPPEHSQPDRAGHWDSLIVAAALAAGCEILYSEEMRYGQVFIELKGPGSNRVP